MGQRTVASYVASIGVTRTGSGDPAIYRHIGLELAPDAMDPIQSVEIRFYGFPGSLGEYANGVLWVMNESAEFEPMHRILQTEAPITCYWQLAATDKLEYFFLRTGLEPLGEGTSDLSPSVP
jgi:hypothetical protein